MSNKQLLILFMTTSLILSNVSLAAADIDPAKSAYLIGDYQKAYTEWLKRAEAGDAEAQFNLGYMFENGQGVTVDHFSAVRWYELAARQNYPAAKLLLQKIRQTIKAETTENIKKWLPQAQAGDAASQLALAQVIAAGQIVEKDDIEALKWLLLSLENTENGTLRRRMLRFDANLRQRMSESDINEANSRATIWKSLRE